MNTFKNFMIGLVAIVLAIPLILLAFISWPFIVGLSSFLLLAAAVILFLLFAFYGVVFIGFLIRNIFKDKEKPSPDGS